MFKRLLLIMLALNLGLASAPAWAWSCAHANKGLATDMLACAKICAKSDALLTQGGTLASLSDGQCMSGKLSIGQDAMLNQDSSLALSDLPLASLAILLAPALDQHAQTRIPGRAPPSFAAQILSAQPHSTSPPLSA